MKTLENLTLPLLQKQHICSQWWSNIPRILVKPFFHLRQFEEQIKNMLSDKGCLERRYTKRYWGTTVRNCSNTTSERFDQWWVTWGESKYRSGSRNAHFTISSINQGAATTYTCTETHILRWSRNCDLWLWNSRYNVLKKVTAIATNTFTCRLDPSSLITPTTDDLANCAYDIISFQQNGLLRCSLS